MLLIFITSTIYFFSRTLELLHLLNECLHILQLEVKHKGSTTASASGHEFTIDGLHAHVLQRGVSSKRGGGGGTLHKEL